MSVNQFIADMMTFEIETVEKMMRVTKRSMKRMMDEAQEPQMSAKYTGGSFEVGKIPIDREYLWSSLVTIVNGVPSAPAVKSYVWRIQRAQPGDVFVFAWLEPYAERIEYGFVGTDSMGRNYNQRGRLFATTAVGRFDGIFADEAMKAGF